MDAARAIVAIHEMERRVFCRIMDMERDVQVGTRIISFWLWLESEGYEDIVKKLCSHDDQFLALASAEAKSALACLESDSVPSDSSGVIPITAKLSGCSASLHHIHTNKDSISNQISGFLNGVCRVIFKDILKAGVENGGEGDDAETVAKVMRKWIRPLRDGTSQHGRGNSRVESKLNPLAKEWYPWQHRVRVEDRSLFITFSNGHPLTETQIWQFFTLKYGDCLESVDIHKPELRKGPPLFGKVVFKTPSLPGFILNGNEEAKFLVKGRPLWCKKYNYGKKQKESALLMTRN